MFCKNCGQQIAEGAAFCTNCGFKPGDGVNFCQNCGRQVTPGATVCVNCGAYVAPVQQGYQQPYPNQYAAAQKSKMAAGLLGIFLGSLGIHNFYLGYTGKAVAQLLISVLSCGILAVASAIWGLVEGILILTGSIATDAAGVPLKD